MPQKTKHTPMMAQYLEMKKQYPDAFLFYRLGDFYEMFYEDAEKAAQILELTLTSRNRNADDPIPMCGVPHHAVQGYVDTLIEKGYKVAICEQMEDPKEAKGMVKREVVQLVTPGTVMDTKAINAKENNYLTALTVDQSGQLYGFAYADLSTGELKVTTLTDQESLLNECTSLQTKEIVLATDTPESLQDLMGKQMSLVLSFQDEIVEQAELNFLTQDLTTNIEKNVVARLLTYLNTTQKRSLGHIQKAESYETSQYLKMDHYAKRNLELTASIRTGQKKGTLLWLLDETKTAMGGRLLKQWLDRPLISKKLIEKRLNLVESLMSHYFERMDLVDALTHVYDLERLAGRVAFGSVNGRDLIQLKNSLQQVPQIINVLEMINHKTWVDFLQDLDPVEDVVALIEKAIQEQSPLAVKEGNVIKDGYDEKLDQYRDAMKNGKQWIAALEAQERERTGIKNLKIGFNRVFGYYIEVTKSNLANIPEGLYDRKQTLANAERFITPELKEKETLILEAEEKSVALEYDLFITVREKVKVQIDRIQKLAKAVAAIDVLQSFAAVSENYHFVRPDMTNKHDIDIKNGRHPVVEKVLGQQTYIPNDVIMDDTTDILLITGPNMSGKSTYMRQLALTVITAQMGCFVPAESATLPVFDQIFTRIGAADDLISGQSTFMVEMMEANQALRNATPNSLILFDEIGRGTATYDGMALAESIIEYIHEYVKAKTLFSTHYHELTALDNQLVHLQNIHVGAIEKDGEVVFLHKIMPGPADKSYGIHVAKLAGLPNDLLTRASQILDSLEENGDEITQKIARKNEENEKISKIKESDAVTKIMQTELLPELSEGEENVLGELRALNLLQVTPLDALNLLNQLQAKL